MPTVSILTIPTNVKWNQYREESEDASVCSSSLTVIFLFGTDGKTELWKTAPAGSVGPQCMSFCFLNLSPSLFCPLEGVREHETQGLLKWIASVLVCLIEGLQHHSPSLRSKKLYRQREGICRAKILGRKLLDSFKWRTRFLLSGTLYKLHLSPGIISSGRVR